MTKAMPFLQKAILLSYDPRRLAGALLVFSKTLNLISLNSDSALFGVAQLGPTARYHGGRTQ